MGPFWPSNFSNLSSLPCSLNFSSLGIFLVSGAGIFSLMGFSSLVVFLLRQIRVIPFHHG